MRNSIPVGDPHVDGCRAVDAEVGICRQAVDLHGKANSSPSQSMPKLASAMPSLVLFNEPRQSRQRRQGARSPELPGVHRCRTSSTDAKRSTSEASTALPFSPEARRNGRPITPFFVLSPIPVVRRWRLSYCSPVRGLGSRRGLVRDARAAGWRSRARQHACPRGLTWRARLTARASTAHPVPVGNSAIFFSSRCPPGRCGQGVVFPVAVHDNQRGQAGTRDGAGCREAVDDGVKGA